MRMRTLPILLAAVTCFPLTSISFGQKQTFEVAKAAHEKVMESVTMTSADQLRDLKIKAMQAVDKFVEQKRSAAKLEDVVAGEKLRTELSGDGEPTKPTISDLEKIWKTYTTAAAALKKQEQEAVRRASGPYLQELERLKQQLTRDGSTAKALEIKAEIDRLQAGDTGAELKSKSALEERLLGKDCEWISDGKVYSKFKFEEKSKIAGGGLLPWLVKWEALSKDEVKIYHSDGGYFVFKLDVATGQGGTIPARGAKKEDKKIQLLPKPAR
jgi:hypothetical protein